MSWTPGRTLDDIEKEVILQAFQFYRGNKTQTANSLGIAIRTLDNKLERYNNGVQVRAGLHVESPEKVSEEQSMPVRKQKKV